jgi:TatD DNase family protein
MSTEPLFLDTHAHLTDHSFEADLDQVISRASAAGISRIVCPGINAETSRRAVALAERFETVYAAVGWHPTHVAEAPDDVRPELRDMARHPKVVAIGETGLDHFHLPSKKGHGATAAEDERYKQRQIELFEQQIELAAELGLPCVIHQRACLETTLSVFEKFGRRVRGQFHCFADDTAAMERILAMGSLVSFTGILTYKTADSVRAALAAAPAGRFMLETDSPYLVPIPHRGTVRRCEPAFVRDIAELAARVKGWSLSELSEATCAAAQGFFTRLA